MPNPLALKEEIVFKKGIRRCSGRIREGKYLYYLPRGLKDNEVKEITTRIKENLSARLKDAYSYKSFFAGRETGGRSSADLTRMAHQIYTRKYPQVDFHLNVRFRRQKTVLGTYRQKKNGKVLVYINDHFRNAPDFLLEYIIAHELSHHHYSGHDKAYYQELGQLCPGHQKKRDMANRYLLLKEAHIL